MIYERKDWEINMKSFRLSAGDGKIPWRWKFLLGGIIVGGCILGMMALQNQEIFFGMILFFFAWLWGVMLWFFKWIIVGVAIGFGIFFIKKI